MADRLSNERLVELVTQSVAEIGGAELVRRYRLGPVEAALLAPVRSAGPNAIDHAFVAIDPVTDKLALAFWVEQNRLASFTGAAPHRLVRAHAGRRTILDDSSRWSERTAFELEALARAEELTGHKHSRGGSVPPAAPESPPPSAPLPSSLRLAASRAYRSRAFRPIAAGLGGTTILFALAKLGLKATILSASHSTPGPMTIPPALRAAAPTSSSWRGDALHGKDDTLDRIAADPSDVYWVSRAEERLYAQSIEQGARRLVAEGLHNPTGIALDEAHVYVTCAAGRRPDRRAAVFRIPKVGGTPAKLTEAMVAVTAPVVHEGYVYFLDGMVLEDIGERSKENALAGIERVPVTGGRSDRYLWNAELRPVVAISDTRVAWLPWNSPEVHVGPIGKRGLHDPEPWVIRLPDAEAPGRGTDGEGRNDGGPPGGNLADGGMRAADAGTARSVEPTAPRVPTDIAFAGETIFVTMSARNAGSLVYRIAPETDVPELLLAAQGAIRDLTADGEALFWIEEGEEMFEVALCGAIPSPPRSTVRLQPSAASPSARAGAAACATSPTGEIQTFAVARTLPRGAHLAVPPMHVYWTTGHGVERVSRDGWSP